MTERRDIAGPGLAPGVKQARGSSNTGQGPDRVTVALFSLATFLVVLALLAGQLPHAGSAATPRPVVLHRVYRTTVIERVVPSGASGAQSGPSVSQSVSGSGAEPSPPALPVTRAS